MNVGIFCIKQNITENRFMANIKIKFTNSKILQTAFSSR